MEPIIIGSNKSKLYSNIFTVAIMSLLFLRFGLHDTPTVFNFIFDTFWISIVIYIALQLFLLPISVVVNKEDKTLTLKFFMRKAIVISISELKEYSYARFSSRNGNYDGVAIRVSNGRQYILSDFSLKDYRPLKNFLKASSIPFDEIPVSSFFYYFITYIKGLF